MADQDEQILAEIAARETPGSPDPAREEAELESDWLARSSRHQLLSTLRAAVEHATARPILQRDSAERLACGVDGELQQHRETGLRRFVVYRCHRRDRCPECSVAYGEERADELSSLMRAVRSLGGARGPVGFDLEVTFPRPVSELIGAAVDGGDFAEARRLVRKLVKVTRAVLWDAVKRRGLDRSDVGAAANVHAFHSQFPLADDWHWHVHATTPNVTRSGAQLRRLGKIPVVPRERVPRRFREAAKGPMVAPAGVPEAFRGSWSEDGRLVEDRRRVMWLSVLRLRLRELVLREFGSEVDLSALGDVNLYWHYFGSDRHGMRAWEKRIRYVARSPWHDAAKIAAERPEWLYGDVGMGSLAKFARRAEGLQHAVKVRRYVGWLHPGQRIKYGLVKDPGSESPWKRCADYYRRILRADAAGLWVRVYGPFGAEGAEHIPGELVSWAPTAPPRRWQTVAQRDEKERRAERARARAAARPVEGPAVRVTPGLFGMVPA